MRTIHLNQRQARLLRDNLTQNAQGFDYLDLKRFDHLAQKLTAIQGTYGERMAELAREEKSIRRKFDRGQMPEDEANRALRAISWEVEEFHEAAEVVEVELQVEDGDHRLILDKLNAVERWIGTDELRHVIIGMVEAVNNAESDQEPVPLRKAR